VALLLTPISANIKSNTPGDIVDKISQHTGTDLTGETPTKKTIPKAGQIKGSIEIATRMIVGERAITNKRAVNMKMVTGKTNTRISI